ncbi:hypothetical protein [Pseudonocardia sp. HH130629-09]|uniref:hypothetical protein n=1 Tax=Pseudonocardia sp. HH130629-09 TaxID=1641402 RepID=UPI0006CB0AEE|nr:hypothetical protein [Pseudonocardia sp. HH130629-09]ALE82935.1 hypothetical protein XF36_07035 [Pseudonocardia sp. HH130629-09]
MLQRRPARPVPPPPLTGGAGFVAGIAAGVAAGLTAGAAALTGAGPGGSAAAAVVVAGVGTVLLAAATTAVGALAVAVVCWGSATASASTTWPSCTSGARTCGCWRCCSEPRCSPVPRRSHRRRWRVGGPLVVARLRTAALVTLSGDGGGAPRPGPEEAHACP